MNGVRPFTLLMRFLEKNVEQGRPENEIETRSVGRRVDWRGNLYLSTDVEQL